MEVNNENEKRGGKGWAISIGLYPGILFGFRTYEEQTYVTHVVYLPFIDLAIEVDK
jgi:hypothetical protein